MAIGVQAKASSTIEITHQAVTKTISHKLTSLVRIPRKIRRYCSNKDIFVIACAAL